MKQFLMAAVAVTCLAWLMRSAQTPSGGHHLTTGLVAGSLGLKVTATNFSAPTGSMVPQAAPLASGDVALTWQEPLSDGGYEFRMSVLRGARWSEARTIARGPNLSMFTADLPGVIENGPGSLLAYWEIKDRRSTNRVDTLLQVATSADLGRTWSAPVQPHRDDVTGEHSFVAAFADGKNTGLVWLDGQKVRSLPKAPDASMDGMKHDASMEGMKHGGRVGAMGLRYVAINGDREIKADSFIDPLTCECCPNSAALTSHGPVVVYRGREVVPGLLPEAVPSGQNSVRDVQISRLENGKWTKPHPVHADRWIINGCPDNGPAVEARGTDVAVAWWTRAGDQRKVQVAFSSTAGDDFDAPFRVDQGDGEGQVTVAWIKGRDAVVLGWLEGHKVWARIVTRTGAIGPPVALASSPEHSRLPRWIWRDGGILASYTALVQPERRAVRVARLTIQ
jgi:hypothetical protein